MIHGVHAPLAALIESSMHALVAAAAKNPHAHGEHVEHALDVVRGAIRLTYRHYRLPNDTSQ